MTETLSINVPEKEVNYPVLIGRGLIQEDLYSHLHWNRYAIITDTTIEPLFAKPLLEKLKASGKEAHLFIVPSGEKSKSREMKQSIEDQMLEQNLGRDTCVIALGGGMITDFAGFIAATYCRGIPLIMIPTSLLAMVDASIGSKNGVNTPAGKNLIGTIYHPNAIIMDIDLLDSLPERQIRNGLVEVIKHALIKDETLFEQLENDLDSLIQKDLDSLEKMVITSCKIKKQVIEQDLKEHHLRRSLNFGHTIGHALEATSNYSLLHGEAVAIGILIASSLSQEICGLSPEAVARIEALLHRCCPSIKDHKVDLEALAGPMQKDKKSVNGQPRFVLLEEIGQIAPFNGAYCTPIKSNQIGTIEFN